MVTLHGWKRFRSPLPPSHLAPCLHCRCTTSLPTALTPAQIRGAPSTSPAHLQRMKITSMPNRQDSHRHQGLLLRPPHMANCDLSGQLPLHLHRTTEGQQRRLRMWKSHWCDDGFAHLFLLLQSRPGLEFGQSCFFRHLCMMMTLQQSKNQEDYMWLSGLVDSSMFWIFCAFFCCHFLFLCHLSYHSTNPHGPSKQGGGQPSCLQWPIFIWDSRPGLVQGTVTEILIMCTRTVYYCGTRVWQRFSSFFKWLLLVWLSLIKVCWLHKEAEGGISGEAGSSLQLVPRLRKWNLIGNTWTAQCLAPIALMHISSTTNRFQTITVSFVLIFMPFI